MSTNVEELVAARAAVEAAQLKLQEAKDRAAGITKMKRADWDTLTDPQRLPLIPAIQARQLVIED